MAAFCFKRQRSPLFQVALVLVRFGHGMTAFDSRCRTEARARRFRSNRNPNVNEALAFSSGVQAKASKKRTRQFVLIGPTDALRW